MRGFTLIETVVYIALLALMMSGTLLAVHQILRSSAVTSSHDAVGMEGDFVLRKLDWALVGARSVAVSAHALSAVQSDGSTVTMRQGGSAIEISGGGAFLPITTPHITTPGLDVKRIAGPDGSAGVEATITLSGKEFYVKKYLDN